MVDNRFASMPFGNKIGIDYINRYNVEFSSSSVSVQNTHNDKIDTVETYTYDQSFFEFYKTSKKVMLRRAVIKNVEIRVGDIFLGMSKSEFLNLFRLDNVEESIIVIRDEEEYASHLFNFDSNGLTEIVLSHVVD